MGLDDDAVRDLPPIPPGGGDLLVPIFGTDTEIELHEAVNVGVRLSRADRETYLAEVARRDAVHDAQLVWGRALVEADGDLHALLQAVPEAAHPVGPDAKSPRSRLESSRQLDRAMAALTAPSPAVAAAYARIRALRAGLAASEASCVDRFVPKFLGLGTSRADLVAAAGEALSLAAMSWDPERTVRFSTHATWWMPGSLLEVLRAGWEARCPPESVRALAMLARRRAAERRSGTLARDDVRALLRDEVSRVDDATLFEWLRLAGVEIQG